MPLDRFIARWSASGDAERANKDSFLNELCDVLEVERPNPKTGDPARDLVRSSLPRPFKSSATVTRDLAEQIAALARALEAAGQDL